MELEEPIPDAPERDQWWTRRDACPLGTTLKGSAPPFGDEVWCERSDGRRHGPYAWWYDIEGKHKVADGQYEEGQPTGLWVSYYDTGKRKIQGRYEAGKKAGRWVAWYPAGSPSTDIRFVDGAEHGLWRWWYDDGSLAGMGEFAKGKPHGRWTRCGRNGEITKVEIYDHDVLVDWIDYKDGRRVAETQ